MITVANAKSFAGSKTEPFRSATPKGPGPTVLVYRLSPANENFRDQVTRKKSQVRQTSSSSSEGATTFSTGSQKISRRILSKWRVLLHEMGHVFGFAHTETGIMYANAPLWAILGGTETRYATIGLVMQHWRKTGAPVCGWVASDGEEMLTLLLGANHGWPIRGCLTTHASGRFQLSVSHQVGASTSIDFLSRVSFDGLEGLPMAYDEKLAARVRTVLIGEYAVDEIKMFGEICFKVDGHMACGVLSDGLIVKCSPEDYDEVGCR